MAEPSLDRATALFRRLGGTLRTKQVLAGGVHPRTLYKLRDQGVLHEVTRGVYRLASLPELSEPDLVTVAIRVPRAVVCLVSALAHHEATVEVPHEVQIALPPGTKSPNLKHPPLRVFRFSGPALTEGIEELNRDGVTVRMYGLAKTVVDCFRFRNKIGLGVAIEGLREALHSNRATKAEILRYARICRIESAILPYLEAVT